MKLNKDIYRLSVLFIIGLFTLSSCGDDRSNEAKELQEVQQWIYKTMEEHYLWNDEIPPREKLNFFEEPKTFFGKLLSKNDGNENGPYSYIENKNDIPSTRGIPQTEYSYGISFAYVTIKDITGEFALVQYISKDKNSPAYKTNLKRGDLISEIDGEKINNKNITKLLGDGEIQIKTSKISGSSIIPEKTINLEAARKIDENPVYIVRKLIENKVGYLMYNQFERGKNNDPEDTTYDDALKQAIRELQGVEDLILDLRYNNGGYVTSAELLISLIGPRSILGTKIGYMKSNKGEETSLEAKDHGINLDLKRLYVITSGTTASASELIINCLRTDIPIHVIGLTTTGKNVGSNGFVFKKQPNWVIHPITMQIYNKKGQSDYKDGFNPGIYESGKPNLTKENYIKKEKLPLGDIGNPETERLLQHTLRIMGYSLDGASTRTTDTQDIKTYQIKEIDNSANRRRANNFIFD